MGHPLKPVAWQPDVPGPVVMIDSDILITGSLDPLLRDAANGRIAAFVDWRMEADGSERRFGEWQSDLELAGPPRRQPHVCSGLIAFAVEAWPHLLARWRDVAQRARRASKQLEGRKVAWKEHPYLFHRAGFAERDPDERSRPPGARPIRSPARATDVCARVGGDPRRRSTAVRPRRTRHAPPPLHRATEAVGTKPLADRSLPGLHRPAAARSVRGRRSVQARAERCPCLASRRAPRWRDPQRTLRSASWPSARIERSARPRAGTGAGASSGPSVAVTA